MGLFSDDQPLAELEGEVQRLSEENELLIELTRLLSVHSRVLSEVSEIGDAVRSIVDRLNGHGGLALSWTCVCRQCCCTKRVLAGEGKEVCRWCDGGEHGITLGPSGQARIEKERRDAPKPSMPDDSELDDLPY